MRWDLIEQAADIVMSPMRNQDVPMVVFDLSDVAYFGSSFWRCCYGATNS